MTNSFLHFYTTGHPDPMLVSNIWTKIIDQQVASFVEKIMFWEWLCVYHKTQVGIASTESRLAALATKVESLGRLYAASGRSVWFIPSMSANA